MTGVFGILESSATQRYFTSTVYALLGCREPTICEGSKRLRRGSVVGTMEEISLRA